MITIEASISELLHLHDCVIIPGFGGFVTNYESAKIDTEKGLFTPPANRVGFNKNLTHNDGLLLHHFAQKNKLTYNESKQQIETFVESLINELNNSGVFLLSDIGSLSLDSEKNYLFSPANSGSFLADSFGLSSFHTPIPEHLKNYNKEKTPVRKLLNASLIKRGVAASIFFALLLSTVELRNPDNVSMGSIINLGIEQPKTIKKLNAQKGATIEAYNNNSDTIFHIIVASFPRKSQAISYLNNSKFKGQIITSTPGKNRISLKQFNNRTEATSELLNIRKQKGFKAAWLLKELN